MAKVTNVTTGSEVTVIGSPSTAGARAFKIIFLIFVVAILVTFAVVVLEGLLGDGF